jgi:hypothetical protein
MCGDSSRDHRLRNARRIRFDERLISEKVPKSYPFGGNGGNTQKQEIRTSRHAELVSASTVDAASRVADWTLKQVQGDA